MLSFTIHLGASAEMCSSLLQPHVALLLPDWAVKLGCRSCFCRAQFETGLLARGKSGKALSGSPLWSGWSHG